MSPSPDLITNIVFGIIMVVIGIVAIWVVRWQTYFLLRHQSKLSSLSTYKYHLMIPPPGPITDEEHAAHLTPKLANITSNVDTDSAPERSLASEASENDSTTSKDQYHIKHTSSSMTDLTAVSVDEPHQL